jgi:hypothetical protein
MIYRVSVSRQVPSTSDREVVDVWTDAELNTTDPDLKDKLFGALACMGVETFYSKTEEQRGNICALVLPYPSCPEEYKEKVIDLTEGLRLYQEQGVLGDHKEVCQDTQEALTEFMGNLFFICNTENVARIYPTIAAFACCRTALKRLGDNKGNLVVSAEFLPKEHWMVKRMLDMLVACKEAEKHRDELYTTNWGEEYLLDKDNSWLVSALF